MNRFWSCDVSLYSNFYDKVDNNLSRLIPCQREIFEGQNLDKIICSWFIPSFTGSVMQRYNFIKGSMNKTWSVDEGSSWRSGWQRSWKIPVTLSRYLQLLCMHCWSAASQAPDVVMKHGIYVNSYALISAQLQTSVSRTGNTRHWSSTGHSFYLSGLEIFCLGSPFAWLTKGYFSFNSVAVWLSANSLITLPLIGVLKWVAFFFLFFVYVKFVCWSFFKRK